MDRGRGCVAGILVRLACRLATGISDAACGLCLGRGGFCYSFGFKEEKNEFSSAVRPVSDFGVLDCFVLGRKCDTMVERIDELVSLISFIR